MSDADERLESEAAPAVDAQQIGYELQQLRSNQNLVAGLLAGLVASLAGAGIWAAVTVATGYQIGWMAVGVGFLVGFAVRIAGKGIDAMFGVAGAVLSLLGCAVGNLLAVCGMVAQQEGLPFMDVVARLDASLAQELMVATFRPMDVLFYGIAIYEGYKLSFRQLTREDLALPDR